MENVKTREKAGNDSANGIVAAGKSKNTKKLSIGHILGFFGSIICAFLLQYPQPKLDWENYVLPMVNEYMMGEEQQAVALKNSFPLVGNDESKNTNITVVISGATSGIGLGLTKAFYRMGASNIIMIGRNEQKLKSVSEQIISMSTLNDNIRPRLVTYVAEYSDLDSVADVANEIIRDFGGDIDDGNNGGIDILINNAGIHEGVLMFSAPLGKQGYDNIFTVNYLSHFLLTEKLLPYIQKKKKATSSPLGTIVQMSSSFHWLGDYNDLMPKLKANTKKVSPIEPSPFAPPIASQPGGGAYNGGYFPLWRTQRGYGNTKLAQILNARALQRRLEQANKEGDNNNTVRVISICPAWVASAIAFTPGSFVHNVFKKLAFPAYYDNNEYPGYGIGSTLYGIFNLKSKLAGDDYFSNARFLNMVNPPKHLKILNAPWTFAYGIRDYFSWLSGIYVLWLQKLLPIVEPMISSPITYDPDVQDKLYMWTKIALKSYLSS